jgi:hypothetical protein
VGESDNGKESKVGERGQAWAFLAYALHTPPASLVRGLCRQTHQALLVIHRVPQLRVTTCATRRGEPHRRDARLWHWVAMGHPWRSSEVLCMGVAG